MWSAEGADVCIDWEAVADIMDLDVEKPSAFKRKRLTVSAETYFGTMVTRWYIESGNQVSLDRLN